jgi:hypothetical protein
MMLGSQATGEVPSPGGFGIDGVPGSGRVSAGGSVWLNELPLFETDFPQAVRLRVSTETARTETNRELNKRFIWEPFSFLVRF